ncbi:MAG: homocysteine S-methyltransferase family protein [Clostridia bacterium]|nr:homocysteine S-methyltransferase family protein [Clostridia bacterium]
MNITKFLKDNIVILDGGMGTLLGERGLMPGELPERWNITHPDVITDIHRAYFEAGSNVVSTNTFGANSLKLSDEELEEIITAAVRNARLAADGVENRFVALDIGPTGRMLKPYGDLDFEDAVEVFAKTVRIGVRCGVDLVFIETMNDSYECKAAVLAAKENSELPVFVSSAYGEDGKLMTGATPEVMVAMLEGLGADAIGVNCSFGPRMLRDVVREYLTLASVPVIFKPNAGMPRVDGGKTVYDVSASDFAREVCELVKMGVSAVGGCCGTTPEYISCLKQNLCGLKPVEITEKDRTVVTSYSKAVSITDIPVIIGERINPTGKKRFKEALRSGDMAYILNEGLSEEDDGADILDVNVGLADIDEAQMLIRAVKELQAVTALPLQIDTSDAAAMEQALRLYNGKAMVNSVNGKRESMEKIFPLVKKYGGVVVALTLDENGIPERAEGRVEIAKRILKVADSYGISKKDIVFDPLALAVSADASAGTETLRAVSMIKNDLGAHTVLGVSNVSFGLPLRDKINSTFFSAALFAGLSCAIINPHSQDMMGVYRSYLAISGLDDGFGGYIRYAEALVGDAPRTEAQAVSPYGEDGLKRSIVKGLKKDAARLTSELLSSKEPLDIISGEIIPALDEVGVGYENKTVYLPGLLMSAEAAKAAFSVIAEKLPASKSDTGMRIAIATVEGDIHDIGKNIVKLLLENYGYTVVDLGKDVPRESILEAVKRDNVSLVCLSALMTTTVAAMEKTITLIHQEAPGCKVIVGGAVLTESYAKAIGADAYGKDAMAAVRYAEMLKRNN